MSLLPGTPPGSPAATRPRLLLFCGIPGSGKTTIASLVAERLPQCVHVQTDQVRAMVSRPTYTGSESKLVYGASIAVAAEALKRDYDAILDGTFPRQEYRAEALSRLARLYGTHLVVLVYCDIGTSLTRNRTRKSQVPDETVLRISRTFETPRRALVIDSTLLSPEESAGKVLAALEGMQA